jgi:2-dehydropantoate 2-reductase
MKFCVYGAGAIGGYLAVELALSGQEVCVVARGPHLEAIQDRGLKLVIQGREKVAKVAAAENPGVFGVQDVMLQDLERGRSLEIDALVTAVQELGRLTGVSTPVVDAVLALVQERGRAAGLYHPLGSTG